MLRKNNKLSILSGYLLKTIISNFLGVLLIFSLIVLGNQFFLVLNQSMTESFLSSELLPLMLLKFFRDFNVLLGLSLVVSITLSLNKMYKNSEAVILKSSGVSEFQIFKMISLLLFLFISSMFLINLFINPMINSNINLLKQNASSRPEFMSFKEGVFQNFSDNDVSFYASEVNSSNKADEQLLSNIFIYSHKNDNLILANKGVKTISNNGENLILRLNNGNIYENLSEKHKGIKITNFKNYEIDFLTRKEPKNSDLKSPETLTLVDLWNSFNRKNYAEIHERVSIPLAVLILSFFSIFISRTSPRSKRNFSVGLSFLAFIGYYYLILILKVYIIDTQINMYLLSSLPHLFFLAFIYLFFNFRKI